jgi:hypothetical protein
MSDWGPECVPKRKTANADAFSRAACDAFRASNNCRASLGCASHADVRRLRQASMLNDLKLGMRSYDPTPEPQTLAERLEAKQRRLGPASPRLPDTSGGTPEASSDTSTAHGAYRRTGERY